MNANRKHIIGLYLICGFTFVRGCSHGSELDTKASSDYADRINNFYSERVKTAISLAEEANEKAEKAINTASDRAFVKDGDTVKLESCETDYWGARSCRLNK